MDISSCFPVKNALHHVTFLLTFCFFMLLVDNSSAQWLNHGGDLSNRRQATLGGGLINPLTVRAGLLRLRWRFLAGFDISATPAVSDGVVYFPSWNGNLYAVNAITGTLIWQQSLGPLTGIPVQGGTVNVTVSRATPVVANAQLLLVAIYGPAYVIAVQRATGQLVWSTRLDPNPLSIVTQSGTAYLGGFYVGVSSLENTARLQTCCTFRGSLAKLDVRTGAIIWQTYTVPDNGGIRGQYAGGSIWGSSPSIDTGRQLVYVGTGQLYSAPAAVLQCQAQLANQTTPTGPDTCVPTNVHFDSIMGLDLTTGRIVWATRLQGYDVFTFACLVPNNPDCPPGPNIDADFGEAPMMLTIFNSGRIRDVVVAVQKSGFAWCLDRGNGDIVWFTKAGPGALEGGGIWGAATDGVRVYTNIVNGDNVPFVLKPSTQTTTAGAWVAMDANTGTILWTTANPSNETAHGPVTVVNGVVFAGSVAPTGPVYGMDARTGEIIWTYNTGATIYGGASAANGCIYIGHGFSIGLAKFHPTWNSGKYLFAFCIPSL